MKGNKNTDIFCFSGRCNVSVTSQYFSAASHTTVQYGAQVVVCSVVCWYRFVIEVCTCSEVSYSGNRTPGRRFIQLVFIYKDLIHVYDISEVQNCQRVCY